MKSKLIDKTLVFISITTLSVFLFYFHTLFYGVKAFDELAIFKETYLPICFNIKEVFELISLLGIHQHFESSNMLYSNISSIRCNPFGNLLQLCIQCLFQKNLFYYHIYSLIIHLINSAIVFLILKSISLLFSKDSDNKTRLCFVSILTLLWSLHPANVESVLLTTNANIVLGHGLSLYTFYIFLKLVLNEEQSKNSGLNLIILFIVFLFALLIAEFHFMLPFILFSYGATINIYFKNQSIQKSLKRSFILALPAFIAISVFAVVLFISNTKLNFQNNFPPTVILERVFWLSPQVLFHFIKLLLFPVKLSVDQTLLVKIGTSLFDPYAIFCICLIFTLLVFSIISLAKINNRFPFFFIIFFFLLLSLFPFSQVAVPVYNLASERYLYFPSFIFIFGLSHCIFFIISKYMNNKKIIYLISISTLSILIIYSIRGYIRTLDWKDNLTLYSSAASTTENPLFKAYRYRSLTKNIFSQYPEREVEPKFQNLAIQDLRKAIILYKKRTRTIQPSVPEIVKVYGLDPQTLLVKSGYLLAQSDFTMNTDPKSALKIMEPYTKDLSILDTSALTFYASLLYYNNKADESEYVLKKAYELRPYSTRVIFSLCDLIYIKYGDLKTIEDYCLKAFKYYPYDSYTLYALANTYKLMHNHERYAYYSYIYGLRNHSVEALKTAHNEYLIINDRQKAEKVEKELQKRK